MSLFRQLRWELFRMFSRKRSYIGYAVFLLFELIVFTFWKLNEENGEKWITRLAGGVDHYFSALTFGFIIVSFTIFMLGGIFVCLVGGDIVAKETEDGNLLLLLARPVTRFKLLLVKFIACQIYTTTLFMFVGLSAFIIGVLTCGWGGGFLVWTPDLQRVLLLDWEQGMFRYFFAIFGFSILYLPVIGIAFFLSCLKIKPAAATILALAIFISDWIFSNIRLPFMDPYREYLMTTRMQSWLLLFNHDIPWPKVIESAAWLLGLGISGFVLGYIVFSGRDIKS